MAKKSKNIRQRRFGTGDGFAGGGGGALAGGGLPGGLGGGNLMSQVRKMQEEMEKTQEELAQEEVVGTSGGGMVEIVMDGHQAVKAVRLKPEVVDPDDVEMLQDLLLAALNDATEKAKALAEERMGDVTGGVNIPGLGF
ncbi:MAG: YbaB/EbfC family nucleoid-associated protein [Chloroflexi bacterium]|nr:YbaB/EbfC family nucleoid-associated protein [Chloroflexota bacterium]